MDIKKIKEKWMKFYQAKKRLVWIGTGVLMILVSVLVIFNFRGNNEEDIQYVQVNRGSLTESIGEVGYVEAQPSLVLSLNYGETVAEYDIKVGDTVSEGEILMELEFSSWPNESLEALSNLLAAELELENLTSSDSELQAALQAVATAEWTVRDKKEDRDAWNYGGSSDDRIDAVRANYIAALQEVWILEEEYEILRNSLETDDPNLIEAFDAYQAADLERDSLLRALNQILGTPYNLEVETDFIEYDQALADLDLARAEYNRIVDNSQEIAAAEANVQALENVVNEARIIAPFDGTVTEISYLAGEFAENGATVVQIDDLENLVVNVDVSEIDIAKIEIGLPVVVTFDALPYQEYSGIVSSISSAGTDKSGTVEFSVTVAITNADESIKPGFTAVVNITINEAEDALLVPTQALRVQGDNYMLMVVGDEGETPAKVRVEIGASSDTFTEIVSGDIKEGDLLLIVNTVDNNSSGGGGFGMMGGMRQITGGGGKRPSN